MFDKKIWDRKNKIINALIKRGFRESCYEMLIETPRTIKIALIDNNDYEKILDRRWGFDGRGYIWCGKDGVKLHRLILNAKPRQICDHINGNKLDNRRSNLRFVNAKQNAQNKKPHSNSKSKYKNVWYFKDRNKWGVRVQGKYIGQFNSEKEAAIVANQKMIELQGKYARLNNIT